MSSGPDVEVPEALEILGGQLSRAGYTQGEDLSSFEAPKAAQAKSIVHALAKGSDKAQLATKRKNAALIVLPKRNEHAEKSFQNFSNMEVTLIKDVNPVELLTYKYVVIADPQTSLAVLQTRVSKKNAKTT